MKLIWPGALIILGLFLVILSVIARQNMFFLLGSAAILLTGILALLNVLDILAGAARIGLIAFFAIAAAGLTFADYYVIKQPLDFQKEKDRRYAQVIQRLKDIRTAQLAYKSVNSGYANNFDTLLNFVQTDSFLVIKAVGEVPDTLTEEEAVLRGLVKRDTFSVGIRDSIFASASFLRGRIYPFYLDSLPYVPFGEGATFELNAGTVERNNVKVPVFQATDGAPFDRSEVLQVGSMSEPTTNGNWGE